MKFIYFDSTVLEIAILNLPIEIVDQLINLLKYKT